MSTKTMKTYDAGTAEKWRCWLSDHHNSESEVWLVFHKRDSGRKSIGYDDAIDEALCFGWVDSLIKRLDDGRYARKFTPRKAESKWSTANRNRYARLLAAGRMMPSGLKRPPTIRSGDAPRPSVTDIPQYIQTAFNEHASAGHFFQTLAPSYQRSYIAWIDAARQQETKVRRLEEALSLLAARKKLGMK